ncbi:uncharacterized protein LOC134215968 [Armigeres subalbatus]|uniref:uncharacterized protein LOC134215968 n=1 Tax=Armigeres subalbatus TaxID=124917 RepID=UPI002ED180AE
MSSNRRNTLVVDFGVLPNRPTLEQVKEVIEVDLKLKMVDVRNIQLHNLRNCVLIELNDAGLALRLQKEHHLRHTFRCQGVKYSIPVYVDGPTTTVRLHDLPPCMSNTTITQHMEQYGKVISIQNEVWKNFFPGIPNGVRVIRMRMEVQIPSRIVIENESTLVTFRGQNKQVTPSGGSETQQEKRTVSNTAERQRKDVDKNCNDTAEATPHAADPNSSDNDSNDDDDVAHIDPHPGTTTKRRLSTGTNESNSNEARCEQDRKRSCGDDCCLDDLQYTKENLSDPGWKVYNTRSKKK